MNGFRDAHARLSRASDRIEDVRPAIERAATDGSIPDELKTGLAEIVEHLRAALDYCANELYGRFGTPTKRGRAPKVYFPIAGKGAYFDSVLGKTIHGLASGRPDIAGYLRSIQVASSPGNQWLCDLSTLAVESKHTRLSMQGIKERRAMRISDGRVGISVAEGGNVTIRNVRIGEHTIEGPEKVDVDHPPAGFTGQIKHVIEPRLVWMFGVRRVDVIGFLLEARNGTRRIMDTLSVLSGGTDC